MQGEPSLRNHPLSIEAIFPTAVLRLGHGLGVE